MLEREKDKIRLLFTDEGLGNPNFIDALRSHLLSLQNTVSVVAPVIMQASLFETFTYPKIPILENTIDSHDKFQKAAFVFTSFLCSDLSNPYKSHGHSVALVRLNRDMQELTS